MKTTPLAKARYEARTYEALHSLGLKQGMTDFNARLWAMRIINYRNNRSK